MENWASVSECDSRRGAAGKAGRVDIGTHDSVIIKSEHLAAGDGIAIEGIERFASCLGDVSNALLLQRLTGIDQRQSATGS